LVFGYLFIKGIMMAILYAITKRVEQKGWEFRRKRAEIKGKSEEKAS